MGAWERDMDLSKKIALYYDKRPSIFNNDDVMLSLLVKEAELLKNTTIDNCIELVKQGSGSFTDLIEEMERLKGD